MSTSPGTWRRPLRWSRAAIAAALLAAAGPPAVADDWKYDGAELARFAVDYERLRDSGKATDDPGEAARVAYFTGFVLGVARANADRGWFCLPDDLMAWHAWDLVAAFLREHPEFWARRPSTIVNGALARRYPCTEAGRAARRESPDKPLPEVGPQPPAAPKPAS